MMKAPLRRTYLGNAYRQPDFVRVITTQPSALMETDEDAPEERSKRLLDCPEEILVLVASALTGTPKSLLAFGAASSFCASLLLRGDEAAVLWDAASAREVRRRRPSRQPWSCTP